ncbi:hypothetical protein ACFL1N_17440 [Thermodesulfobacteriota bacterium]
MKKDRFNYYRFILYISLIPLIILSTFSASGEEDDQIPWITSRDEAIETALSEGKYILLVIGSDT